MSTKNTKLYLELQMEELKEAHQPTTKEVSNKDKESNNKNYEVAKLYEDAAEYEQDLEEFEKELEIVNNNELKNIPNALMNEFPNSDRNYEEELNSILKMGWTSFVKIDNTELKEQLEIIENNKFVDILNKLQTQCPNYKGCFEEDIRSILIKRWENLISIKKEHIKQELDDIKTMGLKPKFVKRIYKQFHGLN